MTFKLKKIKIKMRKAIKIIIQKIKQKTKANPKPGKTKSLKLHREKNTPKSGGES